MNLNQVSLIGRVTKEPELKSLPNGSQVAKFGVATNRIFKSKEGVKKEQVQFHNCVAFGRLAEIIGQYITKGQEIFIGGRIEYRDWVKKDGSKAYATEIIVENMQMGASAKTKVKEEKSPATKEKVKSFPGQELSKEEEDRIMASQDDTGEIDVNDIKF